MSTSDNKQHNNSSKVHEYHDLAIELAKQAGGLIMQTIHRDKKVSDKSSTIDLVTETDRRCEETIIGSIKAKYPDHNFIGEETANAYSQDDDHSGVWWIVDPIDGTNNFVHGLPMVCVSIGIMIDNEMAAGVVYVPVLDELFTAIKGEGSWLNQEKRLAVSSVKTIDTAAIALEFGYDRSDTGITTVCERIQRLLTLKAQTVRAFGSCAINMCYVAAGRMDGYFEKGPKPWDSSAASLMLSEAGGALGDWHVDSPDGKFNMFNGRVLVASTTELLEQIKTIL